MLAVWLPWMVLRVHRRSRSGRDETRPVTDSLCHAKAAALWRPIGYDGQSRGLITKGKIEWRRRRESPSNSTKTQASKAKSVAGHPAGYIDGYNTDPNGRRKRQKSDNAYGLIRLPLSNQSGAAGSRPAVCLTTIGGNARAPCAISVR